MVGALAAGIPVPDEVVGLGDAGALVDRSPALALDPADDESASIFFDESTFFHDDPISIFFDEPPFFHGEPTSALFDDRTFFDPPPTALSGRAPSRAARSELGLRGPVTVGDPAVAGPASVPAAEPPGRDVDDEPADVLDEPASPDPPSSAQATAEAEAIAAPTPNATASAPTRPM